MAFTFYGKSIINDYLIMFINIPYISLNYNSTSNYTSGLKFWAISTSFATTEDIDVSFFSST